jgi:hydroxyethylthiazole kinase-like uncharacterized protein yjeF
MKRNPDSHKGQNGRVLVVGGNEKYHGAPIMAALGAEKSGADLVNLIVPANQQHLARSFSLNLILETFSGKFLRTQDVPKIVEAAQSADVLVIGNGLGEKPQTQRAIRKILQQATCDLVIDAAALQAFVEVSPLAEDRDVVLTPHAGELESLKLQASSKDLPQFTKDHHCTLVLKGKEDQICSPAGELHTNKTGHPIMTKGGTGDVLAGLIGGLMAQGMSGFEASKKACEDWGKVGEYVAEQKGLEVTMKEMLGELGS